MLASHRHELCVQPSVGTRTELWRAGGVLLLALNACGGAVEENSSQPEAQAEPSPFEAPLSTLCESTGSDWLDLPGRLPGRWEYGSEQGGRYTAVGADLRGSWGSYDETTDYPAGTSRWSTDAEGLVVETGVGPCNEGPPCDARFVQRGTVAAAESTMSFYALWPVDPCQSGIVGSYEGREDYENNRSTDGELRLFKERRERLTLRADGSWHWLYEAATYATVNDMGTVFWNQAPARTSAEDRGTYEAVTGGLRFTRDAPTSRPGWAASSSGEPVELPFIGRALSYYSVDVYQRDAP
jgi:hypothetical protein